MAVEIWIDGYNVATTYGLHVKDQGLNELVAWPPLKPVDVVEWYEEYSAEVDLAAPKLDKHAAVIYLNGASSKLQIIQLNAYLSTKPYHTIFTSMGKAYTVRYVSMDVREDAGIYNVELKVSIDTPPGISDSIITPSGTYGGSDDCLMDRIPFSEYNATLLRSSLGQSYAVNKNLLRDNESEAGTVYDEDGELRNKPTRGTLSLLMRAANVGELWRCYNAMLNNLVQPDMRRIDVKNSRYNCYYSSCRVKRLYSTGNIWLEFDIELNVL